MKPRRNSASRDVSAHQIFIEMSTPLPLVASNMSVDLYRVEQNNHHA